LQRFGTEGEVSEFARLLPTYEGHAAGGAVVWGAALQTERARVRLLYIDGPYCVWRIYIVFFYSFFYAGLYDI
jgi:hypothetical protein